jgi:3-hydroxyisobutyryl-CoA hydrolase
MARKILPTLLEWQKSQMANVVVIKGEGRAFCAGGDVAALALANKKGEEGQQESKDYFALEYKLDHLIATYNKPYVAFIDGITMGGGVGLSLHAPFRIATENTVFAMPETTIGFFPDVGASFFLPRMDGEVGKYLALTSEQLKGVDVFWAGIATHYLHSTSLPDLEARLAELHFDDSDDMQDRLRLINTTLEEFCTGLPDRANPTNSVVGGHLRKAIDFAFQPRSGIQEILADLQSLDTNENGNTPQTVQDWAKKTRETILKRSPTSVAVTLRQLREGRNWNIAETFRREHVIASRFMSHPDFVEGVSALLINKPKTTPHWTPSDFQDILSSDLDEFFKPEPTLDLINVGAEAYTRYPHAWTGLPREAEVDRVVRGKQGASKEHIVSDFVSRYNEKIGVKEKVEEVLARRFGM